jgi:hypothetical protein
VSYPGLVVLLADTSQRHMAIEAAPLRATASELAAIAHRVSARLGFQMEVYVTLASRDCPRAISRARQLLRFSQAQLAP